MEGRKKLLSQSFLSWLPDLRVTRCVVGRLRCSDDSHYVLAAETRLFFPDVRGQIKPLIRSVSSVAPSLSLVPNQPEGRDAVADRLCGASAFPARYHVLKPFGVDVL